MPRLHFRGIEVVVQRATHHARPGVRLQEAVRDLKGQPEAEVDFKGDAHRRLSLAPERMVRLAIPQA